LLFLFNCSSDSISPTGVNVSPTGGTGSVNVKVRSGRSWTASTNRESWDWLGISSGDKGAGSGTVNYIVLQNKTGLTRTGTLTIAGKMFTVTQTAQLGERSRKK